MAIDIKKIFAHSLLELSREKSLSKIKVVDIIAHSGAGRQTFYNHFSDKNDLIYYIFAQTLKGDRTIMEEKGLYEYLCHTYTSAQKNAPFFQQACKLTGQNSLSDSIVDTTYNYYKKFIIAHFGEKEIDAIIEKALLFNAYGASRLYIEWALSGMPGAPEVQVQYAIACMPQCLKDHLPI